MLVHICGAPVWQPENSVNIWNLLWLSKQLIVCTIKQASSFPNALTSKKAKNHEIGVYFLTNTIVALGHAPP